MAGISNRKAIPSDLEAKLLVESRNTCNLCWRSREVQIHHIFAVELGGDNSEENLIVVCLNCHSEAHTKKEMARNLKPQTLRLYKETWLDLLRRYPLAPLTLLEEENDVKTILEILRQGHRRALYFPFSLELPESMFRSLDDFRTFLQSIGFKLIKNDQAREHARLLYKALVEASFLEPRGPRDNYCMQELGRDGLSLLELRRKRACFHLNELGRLVGLKEDMVAENEFDRMAFEIPASRVRSKTCFGHHDDTRPECRVCEFHEDCVQASLQAM